MRIKETSAMFYGAKKDTFEKAIALRNNMTETEKALWMRLKSSQLGVRFKAQHPIDIFHCGLLLPFMQAGRRNGRRNTQRTKRL
jgi:very-short-patch-repair endonuclease